MATSTTIANFDPALKRIYQASNVANLTLRKRPLFGMLSKFEKFEGASLQVVFEYGNPQGGSATFATAQANASQVRVGSLQLTRVNDYHVATIDGEAIEATRGDAGAFLQALKAKIDGAMNALSNSIETKLFRNGTGSIAVAGTISTTDETLAQIHEINNFEVGMEVVASAADGGALRTGSATITAINRSKGVLTTDSNWTSQITSFAAGDYLSREGDAQNGGSSKTAIAGLSAWFPASVSPGESFFGLDRSIDSRLYGVYLDESASAAPLEEIYIDAVSDSAALLEGAPSVILHHHVQHRRLVKELGSKRVYSDDLGARSAKGPVAGIGYRALMLEGGPDAEGLRVVAASRCPELSAFAIDPPSLRLNSLGPAVKILQEDDNRMLRQASADGYETRLAFRGNLQCKSPKDNVRLLLPSV